MPESKAHWIVTKRTVESCTCSNCGSILDFRFCYCPFCGLIMDNPDLSNDDDEDDEWYDNETWDKVKY